MKKLLINIVSLVTSLNIGNLNGQGVPIPPEYFAINAWYIDVQDNDATQFSQKFENDLSTIAAAGCRYVRIGGIGPNWEQLYDFDPNSSTFSITVTERMERLIHKIHDAGMEVMVQVSFAPATFTSTCGVYQPSSGYNALGALSLTQQAQVAANLVKALNDPLNNGIFKDRPIKYWIISNEPDHSVGTCTNPGGYGYNTSTAASLIAPYIIEFSKRMKSVDPKIQIVGPELSNYSTANGAATNSIMQELLDPTNSNSVIGTFTVLESGSNIIHTLAYVDIVTFHNYPTSATTSANVIGLPSHATSGISAKISIGSSSNNSGLVEKVASSGRTPSSAVPITFACTEFNLVPGAGDESSDYTSILNGFDNRSFLGGQWLLEMYAEGLSKNNSGAPWMKSMALWSSREGDCVTTSDELGFGLISDCSSHPGRKRPMYWHYDMMANNFKGTFYPATSGTTADIKAFAARSDDRIAVMILNQSSNTHTFEVVLGNITTTTSATLKLGFNIPGAYTGTNYLGNGTTTNTGVMAPNSTILLLYNCVGRASKRYDYTLAAAIATVNAGPLEKHIGVDLLDQQLSFNAQSVAMFPGQYSVQVNMSPNTYTYTWSGPCGHAVETLNSYNSSVYVYPCGQQEGNFVYTYTVSDGNCKTVQKLTVNSSMVTGSPGPFWAYVASSDATCGLNNGSAAVIKGNVTATLTYQWDNGAVTTNSSASGFAPGLHTVVVNHGGTLYQHQFFISLKNETRPPVDLGIDKIVNRYCTNILSAYPDLTQQGYWNYDWYKGNAAVPFASSVNPVTFTNWQSGMYRVRVYDWTTGCDNWDTINIKSLETWCVSPPFANLSAVPCHTVMSQMERNMTITTETLSVSKVVKKDFYLDRVLVVPEGISLTFEDCEVACAGEATIIVQPGGSLRVSKTYFHGCDDNTWGGIEIFGNGGGQGGAQIDTGLFYNSVFKDAGTAITLINTSGVEISENLFINGEVGIALEQTQNFNILKNRLYFMSTGIRSSESPESSFSSMIGGNTFDELSTCLSFDSDNHSNLEIVCNEFLNYGDYAIYSINTTLKDQGSETWGAHNSFTSNSPYSNHQLHHTGAPMYYYCDPSATFQLSQTNGRTAFAEVASQDGVCPTVLSRNDNVSGRVKQGNYAGLGLRVFPNPFADHLVVNYSLPRGAFNALLNITDISGRIIFSRALNIYETTHAIDGLSLPNGVYICTLSTDDGSRRNLKLISIR